MIAASKAAIQPNDLVRFIVDYHNGVDPVEPCAAVMTFCEHLLALQSPSQEAVRDEALEEAAKACESHADDWLPHHIPEKGTSKNPVFWQQRRASALRCSELIRTLKREPNAAAERIEAYPPFISKIPNIPLAPAEPAAAAPDVAKATVAILKAEEVVFNAAIVADDRMRYEEAKNLRKLSDALKQAAALLARLAPGASDE